MHQGYFWFLSVSVVISGLQSLNSLVTCHEIFIRSCPCFIDAIPSHCSLKIHIRAELVALLEVFFCLLYYLCRSQIPLFSFDFYLDFSLSGWSLSLFVIWLSVFKNWLKIQRSGQDWCIVGLYKGNEERNKPLFVWFPQKSVCGGLQGNSLSPEKNLLSYLGVKVVFILSREWWGWWYDYLICRYSADFAESQFQISWIHFLQTKLPVFFIG